MRGGEAFVAKQWSIKTDPEEWQEVGREPMLRVESWETLSDMCFIPHLHNWKIYHIAFMISMLSILNIYLAPWLMEPAGSMPHSQGISNYLYPEPILFFSVFLYLVQWCANFGRLVWSNDMSVITNDFGNIKLYQVRNIVELYIRYGVYLFDIEFYQVLNISLPCCWILS